MSGWRESCPAIPAPPAAITEVSRASEARLAALADYLRAASVQAFAETASVKILLDAEEKRAVEAGLERADAGQEQTAVNTQSDALAQSVKQRTSLEGPAEASGTNRGHGAPAVGGHGTAGRSRGCRPWLRCATW